MRHAICQRNKNQTHTHIRRGKPQNSFVQLRSRKLVEDSGCKGRPSYWEFILATFVALGWHYLERFLKFSHLFHFASSIFWPPTHCNCVCTLPLMRHRVNSTLPGSKDLSLTQPAGVEVFLRRNLLRQFLGANANARRLEILRDRSTALFTLVITLIYVILCAAHLTRVLCGVALKLMRTRGPRLPLLN